MVVGGAVGQLLVLPSGMQKVSSPGFVVRKPFWQATSLEQVVSVQGIQRLTRTNHYSPFALLRPDHLS